MSNDADDVQRRHEKEILSKTHHVTAKGMSSRILRLCFTANFTVLFQQLLNSAVHNPRVTRKRSVMTFPYKV